MAERKQTYEERRQNVLSEMTQTKNMATSLIEVRYGGNVIGEYSSHYHAVRQAPHDILELIKAKTSNPNH
jgi:hypothetical protein